MFLGRWLVSWRLHVSDSYSQLITSRFGGDSICNIWIFAAVVSVSLDRVIAVPSIGGACEVSKPYPIPCSDSFLFCLGFIDYVAMLGFT